jgi:hypothetical protein
VSCAAAEAIQIIAALKPNTVSRTIINFLLKLCRKISAREVEQALPAVKQDLARAKPC